MTSDSAEKLALELANQIAELLDPQQLATLGKGGRVPSTTLRYNVRQAKAATTKLALAMLNKWGADREREGREKIAAWMIQRSFATGHGDSIEDLLGELEWQMEERLAKREREGMEKAARVIPKVKVPHGDQYGTWQTALETDQSKAIEAAIRDMKAEVK